MSQTTTIQVPTSIAERWNNEAKAMRLDLPAYIQYLENVRLRKHDSAFQKAAKATLAQYPETLRKLAE